MLLDSGFANAIINRVDPTGWFDWEGCDLIGDGNYKCRVEEGDTIESIAKEGGAWRSPSSDGQNLTLDYFTREVSRLSRGNGSLQPKFSLVGSWDTQVPVVGTYLTVPNAFTGSYGISVTGIIEKGRVSKRKQIESNYTTVATGTIIGGNIEGSSASSSSIMASENREVVYNFATFERMNFSASGQFASTTLGASGSYYVGHVEGFRRSSITDSAFGRFTQQYEGTSTYVSLAPEVSIPFLGKGAAGGTHFSSSDGTVYGNNIFLSVAVGQLFLPIPFLSADVGIAVTRSGDRSTAKSFVQNCKVDRNALSQSIISGDASPLGLAGGVVALPARLLVSRAADIAAANFNSLPLNSCNC